MKTCSTYRKSLFLFVLAGLFANALSVRAAPPEGYRLVWKDEFEGHHLDQSRWKVMDYHRDDAQLTSDAVSMNDGVLGIRTFTKDGRHYTGFLSTEGKFEQAYGYFEARIRFVNQPGEWSAFWLQSPTLGKPLGDPAAAGTEIDIVEHRVSDQKGSDLSNVMAMNLHWDGYGKDHKHAGSTTRPAPGTPSLQGKWHTYALLWTPEQYVFYLDDVPQWTCKDAVSHRPEFIRLTSEVRDHSWAGTIPVGGFGDRDSSKTITEVDWVRVWKKR